LGQVLLDGSGLGGGELAIQIGLQARASIGFISVLFELFFQGIQGLERVYPRGKS
jgi:hypothetical protein